MCRTSFWINGKVIGETAPDFVDFLLYYHSQHVRGWRWTNIFIPNASLITKKGSLKIVSSGFHGWCKWDTTFLSKLQWCYQTIKAMNYSQTLTNRCIGWSTRFSTGFLAYLYNRLSCSRYWLLISLPIFFG